MVAPLRRPSRHAGLISHAECNPEWRDVWAKTTFACLVDDIPDTGSRMYQIDSVTGGVSTAENNTPVLTLDPIMGWAIDVDNDAYMRFDGLGYPSPAPTKGITMAVVFRPDGPGSTGRVIMSNSLSNQNVRISRTVDDWLFTYGGQGSATLTGISAPTLGNQYFYAVSHSSDHNGSGAAVVKDLSDGTIESQTFSLSNNPTAGNGGIGFAGYNSGSANTADGALAMGMIVNERLSLEMLLRWADDPYGPFFEDASVLTYFGTAIQFARPDADVAATGWTPTPSSPTTLYDKLDETTASDTDYISATAT